MDNPSSTSSSDAAVPSASTGGGAARDRRRGIPWAGALAALLLLAAGLLVYGARSTWELFRARVSTNEILERGVIHDRLELLELPPRGAAVPVFVMGSSRVQYGFRKGLAARPERSGLHIVKLAHAQFGAFEIRAAVDEILPHDPPLVVIGLSELDTHGRIDLDPGASFENLSALFDLVREGGAKFALDQRVMLYRIAFASVVDSYHYRGVLDKSGLGVVRRFSRDERFPAPFVPPGRRSHATGETLRVPDADRRRLESELDELAPGRDEMFAKVQFDHIHSITRGHHAEISMGLLRRAVALLREADIRVVLVELPLYPTAALLYDTSIRRDFLAFARELVSDLGVRFISLEDSPMYSKSDFGDVLHLDDSGAAKFTAVVLSGIREAL